MWLLKIFMLFQQVISVAKSVFLVFVQNGKIIPLKLNDRRLKNAPLICLSSMDVQKHGSKNLFALSNNTPGL